MNKIIILIVIIFLLAGCQTFFVPADDGGSTVQGVNEVVKANNKFAIDLFKEYSSDENIFFSPYSISAALAMTYEGAKGQTAEEMQYVFNYPESNILRPNFASIYNEINKGAGDYELKTGNALWVQQDLPLLEEYLTKVDRYYGGKATNLDFIHDTENSRQTINTYIEEQTNYKIKDLIPRGLIGAMTRLVLTNAIYFKGTWEWEFDKSKTSEMDFKVNDNNKVKVDMMFMEPDEARFNYANLEELQVLELPYKGDEISMLILLPKQGEEYDHEQREMITYDNTIEDIDLNNLDGYKAKMQETSLDAIYLPKFEFDTKYFMADTLAAMGMPTAFSPDADFSGMTLAENLLISQVIHQAYVKVDEKGTEAAAATAVIMKEMAVMPSNIFRADHPFIFLIQQKDTGNILFLGKVVDPSA